MTIALVLSCISTAIKTAAWYGQTIIPDNFVLPSKWSPSDPNYRLELNRFDGIIILK
jgi:hypothetical protein